jgi:hypothetical protein
VNKIGLANPFNTTAITISSGECNIPAQKYDNPANIYIILDKVRRYFGFILSLIYAIGIERLSLAVARIAHNNQTIHIVLMICFM